MADARSSLRRRRAAFAAALVLALTAIGFLGWSIVQHHDAREDLTQAEHDLVTRRAHSSRDARDLKTAQAAVASVSQQLHALGSGVNGLADLDQHDLDAVRAGVQAGLGGDLAGYNSAADQRAMFDAQHDTTVEQLRQQANAVITALDPLR